MTEIDPRAVAAGLGPRDADALYALDRYGPCHLFDRVAYALASRGLATRSPGALADRHVCTITPLGRAVAAVLREQVSK